MTHGWKQILLIQLKLNLTNSGQKSQTTCTSKLCKNPLKRAGSRNRKQTCYLFYLYCCPHVANLFCTDSSGRGESTLKLLPKIHQYLVQSYKIWVFLLFLHEVQESIFKITLSFWDKCWKITVIWPNKNTAKSSFRKKFVYIGSGHTWCFIPLFPSKTTGLQRCCMWPLFLLTYNAVRTFRSSGKNP